MELEPRGMHTSLRQNLEFVMKKYFSFDFHILSQQIHIGDRIFPCRILKNKIKKKTILLLREIRVDTFTYKRNRLLNCCIAAEKKQINIHIDTYFANQNSDHDDKSTL